MKFVAFDLETTGFGDDSAICEIAFVKFDGVSEIEKLTSLVKPGPNAVWVKTASEKNGISKNSVRSAPSFSSLLVSVRDFVGELPLVAHNASFDVNTWVSEGGFEIESICTKVLAKSVLGRTGELSTLAEQFSIRTGELHRAEADAILCGQVFAKLLLRADIDSVSEVTSKYPESLIKPTQRSIASKKTASETEHSMRKSDFDALASDPRFGSITNRNLSGKTVIFSQTKIVKASQGQIVMALLGGKSKDHVDTRTDYLVVPELSKVTSEPTTKMKKALALQAAGKKVQIISEQEFLELLESTGSLEEVLSQW
jgi:DNA polymerase III epsilon subunit-like protein